MVHSLSHANFGSAALQRNVTIFLTVPVKKKKKKVQESLTVDTRRSESQGSSRNRGRRWSEASWALPLSWRQVEALGRKALCSPLQMKG